VSGIQKRGWKTGGFLTRAKPASTSKKPLKFKSGFEEDFHAKYPQLEYEQDKIKYKTDHTYTPDWKIRENTYIETKGYWNGAGRAKTLRVLQQNPDIILYLVFMNPNNKLNRRSNTTYAEFCDEHGIPWATIDTIPEEWFKDGY
jgi:hypothetical protein